MSSDSKSISQKNAQKNVPGCPISSVAKIIGDTWILLIIYTLLKGEKRFGELQTAIPEINSRTLTLRLKQLDELGWVNRVQYNQIPPKVVYSLTGEGQKLRGLIEEVVCVSNKLV